MNKQNNGLRAFFAVLMCIPIGFIIYFAVLYTNHNIPVSEVVSVSITAGDGKVYNYTDEETRTFFLDVYLDAAADESINSVPLGVIPASVACDRGDKRIDYKLYPSVKDGTVIMQDENGYFYSLPSDVEQHLLVRSEFQYLYAGDLLPAFTVVSGDRIQEISPVNYKWSYKKADGKYYSDNITIKYEEGSDLRIYSDRENSIGFSVQPSTLELRINGESVAPGSFSSLAYSADTTLDVSVRATWVNDGESNYGTAEYNFKILYDIPAKVYLSNDVCVRGDTLLLRVDMLTDGETVELESDLITTAPEFEVQGGVAYAILPISLENEPGTYDLTFISGENTVKLTLDVVEADYGFGTYHYPNDLFMQYVANDKIEELSSAIDNTVVFGGAMFFTFDSSFALPCEGGEIIETYGKSIVINDETAQEAPFSGYVPGNVYQVAEGTSVVSMQRGKVVYAGETALTGGTVIISHGMGIYSYYFHVEHIAVTEGTTVQKGAILGKAGTSPLSPEEVGNIVHNAISVGKVFVDPKPFIEGTLFID